MKSMTRRCWQSWECWRSGGILWKKQSIAVRFGQITKTYNISWQPRSSTGGKLGLSPIWLHHASPTWKEHGENGHSVLSVWSWNRLRRQRQHGPPYSEFLCGLSVGRFRDSRRGARNTEGFPEGNTRWRERGAGGEGCEEVTRFIGCSIKSVEWSLSDGLLYFWGKIYVPDTSNLRQRIIMLSHDSRLAGHSGRWKTLEIMSQNYWWPHMSRYFGRYVSTCDMCLRTKSFQRPPTGELHPLPIPSAPWDTICYER